MACSVKEAQSHEEVRVGRRETGVHSNVMGIQNESVNGDKEKPVGKNVNLDDVFMVN